MQVSYPKDYKILQKKLKKTVKKKRGIYHIHILENTTWLRCQFLPNDLDSMQSQSKSCQAFITYLLQKLVI